MHGMEEIGTTSHDRTGEVSSWKELPSAIPFIEEQLNFRSFGCGNIDSLLNGELPSARILEIEGGSCTSKTRLMLSTAIACASEGCRVLFIDTANGVSTSMLKRCVQECSLLHLPGIKRMSDSEVDINKMLETAMDNLEIARLFELTCLMDVLTNAALNKKYDVVIIDSLHNILSPFADSSRLQSHSMHIVEAWVADLCLLVKSLSAVGTTVMFTTVPPSVVKQGKEASQYEFRHILMEILDVRIRLKTRIDASGDSISADVSRRPPYYSDCPATCSFRTSDLFKLGLQRNRLS